MALVTYEINGKNLLSKKLKEIDQDAKNTDREIGKIGSGGIGGGGFGGGDMFKSIVGGNLFASVISRGIGAVKDLGSHVLENTIKFQAYENVIRASSRSEEEGAYNIAFLNKEIKDLGLNIDAAYKGYKTFSGSLIGTSLQGGIGNKVFDQISKAGTVMHLSGDQMEGAFLALGQMVSKGTVQAEELRGQLGERIPGAFNIAAKAMHMSTAQLGKFMQQGKLLAKDFLPAFGNELERMFGDKLPTALESLQSKIEKTNTEWENLLTNLGKSKTGTLNLAVDITQNLLKNYNEHVVNENRRDEALNKYGGEYTNWQKTSEAFRFGKHTTGAKAKDEEFEKSLHENYGANTEDTKLQLADKLITLTKMAKGMIGNVEGVSAMESQRRLSIIKYEEDELRDFIKAKDIKNNVGDNGNGKDNNTGTGTTIEAGTPKNLTINLYGGLGNDMTIESVNGDIPTTKIKDNVLNALLEIVNDGYLAMR